MREEQESRAGVSPKSGERSAARELPLDRFDSLPKPDRIGAHRISARIRRPWRYVLVAIVATAILTTAGIIGLTMIDYRGTESLQDKPSTPTEEPIVAVIDPTATVVVLNGTATPSLATGVDQVITANQWGQIAFSDDADTKDVRISAVFYSDIADLPAAEGLAEKLGGVSTYQSDSYTQLGVRLVVLLGADYAGPGIDEAAAIAERLGN